jgi:hypothetical protein
VYVELSDKNTISGGNACRVQASPASTLGSADRSRMQPIPVGSASPSTGFSSRSSASVGNYRMSRREQCAWCECGRRSNRAELKGGRERRSRQRDDGVEVEAEEGGQSQRISGPSHSVSRRRARTRSHVSFSAFPPPLRDSRRPAGTCTKPALALRLHSSRTTPTAHKLKTGSRPRATR